MLSALFAGTIFALSLSNVLAAVTFKGVNIAGFVLLERLVDSEYKLTIF